MVICATPKTGGGDNDRLTFDSTSLNQEFDYVATRGGVAEWSNAAVLKTVELEGSGGSNPSSSAIL